MRRRDEKFPDNGFEAWGGYMQAKIAKLEEQFDAKAQKENVLSNIFNGICIYVNGYTNPSADELKALMPKHGGVYHTYQRSDDYIIASNLPDTKLKNMCLTKVVRPEWITESVEANRLLDYRDYLLFKHSRAQKQLNFTKIVKQDVFETCMESLGAKVHNQVEDISKSSQSKQDLPNALGLNSTAFNDDTKNSTKDTPVSLDITKPNLVIQQSVKTAADPNFISEFYNNSRLHHISQLGAYFKQLVNDFRESSHFIFPAREQLKQMINSLPSMNNNMLSQIKFEKGKIIMHIDMDCFFVSVGLRNRPELHGKPVAVTHSKNGQTRPNRPGVDRNTEFNLYRHKQAKKLEKAAGAPIDEFETRVDSITDEGDKFGSMSEIASCSYEARAKGVGNGMFMGTALKLCPDLQTIPYDFEGYKEVANTLYNTIAQYTLDIEAVSCDEMYVDCTDLIKDMDVSVQDFASAIRNEIKSKTGCPCSTGFGGNRLQARLATKRAKPDGQFFLSEEIVPDFMNDIQLKDLPGVGRQTAQKLESLGHTTCGSLQQLSLASLKCHLGVKTGMHLFDQCRGKDANPLTFQTIRKSVSAEVNYGIRFENMDQCVDFLKQLSTEVHSRMVQYKVVGKCITLKLMVRNEEAPVETAKFMGHGFCNVINKSNSLNTATNDFQIISKEVISIIKKLNIDPKEMRGVGIQMTKLESTTSKSVTGAISKFLCAKSAKVETKNEINPSTLVVEKGKGNANEKNVMSKHFHSPKKQNICSSPKKSPQLQSKSPQKRRGRPPKIMKPHQPPSRNLMTKFFHGQQNITKHPPYRDPMLKNDSIKYLERDNSDKAMLEAFSQSKNSIITDSHTPIRDEKESKYLDPRESKSHIRREPIVQELPQRLLGLPWRDVRELLRAWLNSGQTPLPCDIDLISSYMREMVINKNLEKLNILLNFFKRITHEMGNKEWIEVYKQVLEQVQNAMIAVYGKRLYL